MATNNPAADKALKGPELMLNMIYDWMQEAEEFLSSGGDDDDVIVVHDSRGRLIDLDVREGLQQELTVDELNDRINDALESNSHRAMAGIDAISQKLFDKCATLLPPEVMQHPVANDLASALTNTKRR